MSGFICAFYIARLSFVKVIIHKVVGIIVFALTMLQALYGVVIDRIWRNKFNKTNEKPSTTWIDKVHWWLGRSVIFVAFINIVLGIVLVEETFSFLVLFFIFVVCLFILAFVFESKRNQNKFQIEQTKNPLTGMMELGEENIN